MAKLVKMGWFWDKIAHNLKIDLDFTNRKITILTEKYVELTSSLHSAVGKSS